MKEKLKQILRFIANPRLILCWSVAWFITNGWSYISLLAGTHFDITWLTALAGGYIAFLWLPISPEKVVTLAIAVVLLRLLFPNDERTLGILKKWHTDAKSKVKIWRLKKKKSTGEIKSETHNKNQTEG